MVSRFTDKSLIVTRPWPWLRQPRCVPEGLFQLEVRYQQSRQRMHFRSNETSYARSTTVRLAESYQMVTMHVVENLSR